MSLFAKKKTAAPVATDEIPEKIHKRLHLIYFTLKCILGALIFMIFSTTIMLFILDKTVGDVPDPGSEDSPFLNHEYCGTFFVEINRDNSFASPEAYSAYLEKINSPAETEKAPVAAVVIMSSLGILMLLALLILQKKQKLRKFPDNRYVKTVWIGLALFLLLGDVWTTMSAILLMLVFLALRSGEKKTIFSDRSSDYFLLGGSLWLVGNIIRDAEVIMKTAEQGEGMTGAFSHPVYYMQLYNIAAIPLIMICGGLMLRRHELNLKNGVTAMNSKLLKGTGAAILAGAGAFIFYRLGVRIYELVRVMSGDEYTVKLPFTVMDHPFNKLIDLPYEMADTPQDYRNIVLFRFVKDFPIFVLSAAVVIFFVKVLFNVARGELNTRTNRKYLNISILVLLAASLWFNLMGVKELDFFNNGFHNIYGGVTYTVAIRSMTEPALYAMVLWFFRTYLQAIPEQDVSVL